MPKERKTRTFSYPMTDDVWFERLTKDARRNGRSSSGHLLFIIRDHFERTRILERINNERKDTNVSRQ